MEILVFHIIFYVEPAHTSQAYPCSQYMPSVSPSLPLWDRT
ncbi:hypothetical protein MtrunA17_Chr5g0409161 [Medicago truncatula]|uniref:Uncharacterized protein n=1 Tax=Medicago truncatula TaxID=3880 RepID=A0A396HVC1_MEDTR|nr:hypothetical protein MtrunA17_Chr5g0409161 [Medicago truncatula]